MNRKYTFPAGRRYIAALSGVALGLTLFAGAAANKDDALPLARTASADVQAIPQTMASLFDLDMTTTGTVASGLFGSVAFPFKPGALFRWREIERNVDRLASGDCDGNAACRTRLKLLRETTDAVRDQSIEKKIAGINVAVNRLVTYSRDADVHGKLDYWATPTEILATGKGDCEDYAILKLAALRNAGVPAGGISLVVLRETKRNFYHAVLTVSVGNKNYVLDNMRNEILVDRQLPQYQALYSLDTQRAWIHGYKRGSEFAMQKRPLSLDAVQPGEGIPSPL